MIRKAADGSPWELGAWPASHGVRRWVVRMRMTVAQSGLVLLAAVALSAFLHRLESWRGLTEPGGIYYWAPVIAQCPMIISLFVHVAAPRRQSLPLMLRVTRWAWVSFAAMALLLIGGCEVVAWDWKLRGSPTAMGNLEMIPIAMGLFVGWIVYGAWGCLAVISAAVAWWLTLRRSSRSDWA